MCCRMAVASSLAMGTRRHSTYPTLGITNTAPARRQVASAVGRPARSAGAPLAASGPTQQGGTVGGRGAAAIACRADRVVRMRGGRTTGGGGGNVVNFGIGFKRSPSTRYCWFGPCTCTMTASAGSASNSVGLNTGSVRST